MYEFLLKKASFAKGSDSSWPHRVHIVYTCNNSYAYFLSDELHLHYIISISPFPTRKIYRITSQSMFMSFANKYMPLLVSHNSLLDSTKFVINSFVNSNFLHSLPVWDFVDMSTTEKSEIRERSLPSSFALRLHDRLFEELLCLLNINPQCIVNLFWNTRAPSRYKDRLIYVWSFPC